MCCPGSPEPARSFTGRRGRPRVSGAQPPTGRKLAGKPAIRQPDALGASAPETLSGNCPPSSEVPPGREWGEPRYFLPTGPAGRRPAAQVAVRGMDRSRVQDKDQAMRRSRTALSGPGYWPWLVEAGKQLPMRPGSRGRAIGARRQIRDRKHRLRPPAGGFPALQLTFQAVSRSREH